MKNRIENELKNKCSKEILNNILFKENITSGDEIQQGDGYEIPSSYWINDDWMLPFVCNGKFKDDAYYIDCKMIKTIFSVLYDIGFTAQKFSLFRDRDNTDDDYPMQLDAEIIFEFKHPCEKTKLFVSFLGDFDDLHKDDILPCVIGISGSSKKIKTSKKIKNTISFRTDFSYIKALFAGFNDDFKNSFRVIGSYCLDGTFKDIDLVCNDPLKAYKLKERNSDKIDLHIILKDRESFNNIENLMTFYNDCFYYDILLERIIFSKNFVNSLELKFNQDSLQIFRNFSTIEREIEKKLKKGYYISENFSRDE